MKKTVAIVPINEDLIHQHHLNLELSDEYKNIIDRMLEQEANEKAQYVSLNSIENRFNSK